MGWAVAFADVFLFGYHDLEFYWGPREREAWNEAVTPGRPTTWRA